MVSLWVLCVAGTVLPRFAVAVALTATELSVRGGPHDRQPGISVRSERTVGKETRNKAVSFHATQNVGPPQIPWNSRVAVLLRGRSYRHPLHGERKRSDSPGCLAEGRSWQLNATKSLMQNIVAPLEARGNRVDLFVTDGPCNQPNLVRDLHALYSGGLFSQRRVLSTTIDAKDQWENWGMALDFVERSSGGIAGVASTYANVVMTRHDMVFKKPIDKWHLNSSNYVLAAPCSLSKWELPQKCVSDLLHVVPGRMYPAMRQTKCFNHWCLSDMIKVANTTRANVQFAFWTKAVPEGHVRSMNDWYYLY